MVTHATIATSSWDTIYNHLQTGTYAISTNNIYSAFNDRLLASVGLPLVIIRPPSIFVSLVDLSGAIKRADVTFSIDIYNSKAETVKSLADEVVNKLVTGYSVFETARLKRVRDDWIKFADYDSWQDGNHKIHMYTIEAKYRYID